MKLIPDLRRVKKERPIVGGRRDVLPVRRVKRVPIWRPDQARVIAKPRVRDEVIRDRFGLDVTDGTRRIQHVKMQLRGDCPKARDLIVRKRRFLEEKRRHVLLAYDREAIGRGPAARLACLLGERDEPQAIEYPAGDRERPAVS